MTEESPKNKPWAWIIALVIGGGILLLAWDRFGFGGDAPLAGGQGLVDQAIGASSPWTYGEESDPMTDELTVTASRQIEADGFFIETTVACQVTEGILTYSFTTFDADGFPVEFRQELGGTTMNIIPYHIAHFRPDTGTAQVIKYSQPRYTNLFELPVPTIGEDAPAYMRQDRAFMAYVADLAQLVSAQQLTVRLPLTQGEPVIRIDQTEEVVAGVLSQCAQAAMPVVAASQSTETSRPAGPQTHTFTIVSNYRINNSRNEVMSSLDRSGAGVERTASLCVGDKLVVENDAAEPVSLTAEIVESDGGFDLGTAAPGSSISLDYLSVGEFVISSAQHATARLRYRVVDCS